MSTASASTCARRSARENGDYSQGAAFFDAIRQDPVMAQAQADRRAVGRRPLRLSARQFSAGLGRVERPVPRHGAALLEGRQGARRRAGVAASPARPTSSAIAAGGPGPASISSPPMTASRCRTSSATSRSTTRPTAKTIATGTTPISAGTAASRGRPTIPQIVALRDRQKRNFMATLLLSLGVPMLLAGDEIGRTPARQQQRLLPGQRDLLARLGKHPARGRGARAVSCAT